MSPGCSLSRQSAGVGPGEWGADCGDGGAHGQGVWGGDVGGGAVGGVVLVGHDGAGVGRVDRAGGGAAAEVRSGTGPERQPLRRSHH